VAIVIDKLDRRLYLLRDGRVAATFDADLGRNALSGKAAAGDGATPEGRYHITEKRANGATRWYKALVLNYPNDEDKKAFEAMRRRGEIPRGRGPGSLIEIHGLGGKQSNWTDGCVALQNSSMDSLFAQVPTGTPVTIVGVAQLPGEKRPESGPR
jgi:murein L,D-transpeptidase YafK